MELESGGWDFKFEKDGTVTGSIDLNGATIKIKKVNGKDWYTVTTPDGNKSYSTPDKDAALGWLAQQGYGV